MLVITGLVVSLFFGKIKFAANSGTWERLRLHLQNIDESDSDSETSIAVPFVNYQGERCWVLFAPIPVMYKGQSTVALLPIDCNSSRDALKQIDAESNCNIPRSRTAIVNFAHKIGLTRIPLKYSIGDIENVPLDDVIIVCKDTIERSALNDDN